MPDELDRAAARAQQFLRTMKSPEYDIFVLLLTGNDPYPLGENPACRVLAAAVLNGIGPIDVALASSTRSPMAQDNHAD